VFESAAVHENIFLIEQCCNSQHGSLVYVACVYSLCVRTAMILGKNGTSNNGNNGTNGKVGR